MFVVSAVESDFQLAALCVSDAPPAYTGVKGQIHLHFKGVNKGLRGQKSADLYLQVPVGQQGIALLLAQSVDVSHQTIVVISELFHLPAQPLPFLLNLLHTLSHLF